MKLDKIGIWSEIKLDIIKEYASAFTTIMKSEAWCKDMSILMPLLDLASTFQDELESLSRAPH